ncbi:tRNA(Arg) A34 adenosine deaminase TadA [Candidatus Electrothrix communis]|uniref:tRNA(Arg) A34 adenosine deaminase TadA n=1 Tax=Candidatus Electrothrix communis TaxID=1859133 RepID=A0A3S3UGQ3_9BACT|nr:tRNA(Arg) A34 adenosine deaminase TadA [Candidatus Electrothrix communis]WLE98393.1 MAG: nucleoside deaminase [Candidatus Electrothrix communis]
MMEKKQRFDEQNTCFDVSLPAWAIAALNDLPEYLSTHEERMQAVIEFSRMNFQRKTGGPFAAGVFERDSGRLVVIGVNRVLPCSCSSAHAEITALSLAQKLLGVYDLGATGLPAHQLVVNWRPCSMCFGAVLWSGIRSLMLAGPGPDLEIITGFDEGPIHPDWRSELVQRGIELQENILRDEAIEVFKEFSTSGGFVYNARLG